jgi:hypothetical protein
VGRNKDRCLAIHVRGLLHASWRDGVLDSNVGTQGRLGNLHKAMQGGTQPVWVCGWVCGCVGGSRVEAGWNTEHHSTAFGTAASE